MPGIEKRSLNEFREVQKALAVLRGDGHKVDDEDEDFAAREGVIRVEVRVKESGLITISEQNKLKLG